MTAAASGDPLGNARRATLPAAGHLCESPSGIAVRPEPCALRRDLRLAAEEYSQQAGGNVRGGMRLYAKAGVLCATASVLYLSLLLYVPSWTFAIPMLVLLGICLAGIAFNISHDASHGSFCRSRFGNRLLALTFDLLGASSYCWYRKHNVKHHGYTNIEGEDEDIQVGLVGRLSPYARARQFHRYQHIYLWPLYGLLAFKWHFYDDYRDLMKRGMIGRVRISRPKGWEMVLLVGGKLAFLGVWFALPATQRPIGAVLIAYLIVASVLGLVLSLVFQLAHCVEETKFSQSTIAESLFPLGWEAHQIEATANFACQCRWLTWFVGGLNHQIEHHLFPRISHIHYPALAPLVEEICRRHGVRYSVNESLWGALGSHYLFLRRLGREGVLL